MRSTALERVYRYELAESALELYRKFDVLDAVGGLATCSRFAPLNNFCFGVLADGSVQMYGLNKCHRRASCPVCALGADVSCLNEIQHGIWKARKRGWGVYLVTFTFAHTKADTLEDLQIRFSGASQHLYRSRAYRSDLSMFGYHGRISNYEVQLCGDNGYHPHRHELFFMSQDYKDDLDFVEWVISKHWLDALANAGLSAREDVAVKVKDYRGVGDYMTKMASEITLNNHSKESWTGSSMSPFDCLKAYHETHDMFYGAWWVDYVVHVKGKRMLGWSRGLKSDLGVKEYMDDLTSESQDYKPLIVLDGQDARRLSPSQWRTLSETVNSGNINYVLGFLQKVGLPNYLNPDGLKIYEERRY